MKRFGWVFLLLLAVTPAWAAKKLTVQQLKDLLTSLHQANKTDAEVAAELVDIELTEELSRPMMNSLASVVPGQQTTEQLFILEARSAVLPPPPPDIPATPAPDAATQKAILDKAEDHANKTYAALPKLTATKTTRRFQDNADLPIGSFGARSSAVALPPTPPIHYVAGTENQVTLQDGAEQVPVETEKTKWGANGMIALLGPSPNLSNALKEAQGRITWLRWETVNGHPAAIYSFTIDKKNSRYAVNYCCFPEESQGGEMQMRGKGSTAAGAGSGNYSINANWKNWKATVPYHGEIFVDPDTGVVMRLITVADFKSSEWVRQEDQRIDFAQETIGGKQLVVPIRSIVNTVVLPYGDDGKGRFVLRHTLFTSEYKSYQTGS